MTIQLRHFKAACPENRNPEIWLPLLNEMLPLYGIDTLAREALWLCQTGHESAGYTRFRESFAYSADRLLQVFPRHYKTRALAVAEARKPDLIANRTYGGRMGNVHPGDGHRFSGLGVIHLTGRSNHAAFGKSIGKTAEEAREYMQTNRGMLHSGLWFWQTNNLNRFATSLDIEGSTRVINGGLNGLSDRKARLTRILQAD